MKDPLVRDAELGRLNRTLIARSHSSRAMMEAQNESEYLHHVCRIIVEDCGHAMVWIGYAENDEEKSVRPVAHAGFEEGYLENLHISWAETDQGLGPTGTAIREGRACSCDDMLRDPRFVPWREAARQRGYRSSLVLPLLSEGKPFGAMNIYAREPNAFSSDDIVLLTELASDLSFGVEALRLREANRSAEFALRRSEERYRRLVELSPDAIVVSRNAQIVFLNPAAVRLFAAPGRTEMLGKSLFDVFHPSSHHTIRSRFSRLETGKATPIAEERIVDSLGTVKDVEVASSPIEDAEGPAIQTILRDITKRRRAEEGVRFLAQAGNVLTQILDIEGITQSLAGLAVPFLGEWCVVDMLDESGVIRRPATVHVDLNGERLLRELSAGFSVSWEDDSVLVDVLRSGRGVIGSGTNPRVIDILGSPALHERILTELHPVSCMCVPFRRGNSILGAATFFSSSPARDYDEDDLYLAEELCNRVAASLENAKLYGELRDLDRRKDDFLAILAHELRNPLAAIVSGLRLLGLPRMADRHGWIKDSLDRQTKQLGHLLDDLLDVSRMMRGKITLRIEEVLVSSLVQNALQSVQDLMEAKHITLSVTLPEEPLFIKGDPTRTEQIIVNLLTNAVKYTDDRGSIALEARKDGELAAISIKDNGIGIPPEMHSQIFELFGQVQGQPATLGGLGIGLNLVRRLTEMHGGNVSVSSDGNGKGSNFTVRLPLADEGNRGGINAEGAVLSPGLRVLIVEDNCDIASMTALYLRERGQEVEVACDGFSAVEMARRWRPDVVLLDIGLPGIDGYEVARRLRTDPEMKDALILGATGYGQERDRERSHAAGFDLHLVKPVEFSGLIPILAKWQAGGKGALSNSIPASLEGIP